MPKLIKNAKVRRLSKKSFIDTSKIPFLKIVVISIILNFMSVAVIILAKNNIPPQVPLYYGTARSDRQLSSSLGLILPSLIALGVILINSIISFFITSDYLKKALIISSFLVTALSLITTAKIVLLVGSF